MHPQVLLTYSLIHFIVDFACAALVSALALQHHAPLFAAIVSYNFFAFFMQMPLGIIADKLNKNAWVAAGGCLFVLGAFALQAWPFEACVVAGIGNALFHLGGGIDVLNLSHKRAAPVGIFVSTGALGLFLGTNRTQSLLFVAALLLLSACLLICLAVRMRGKLSNLPMIFPTITAGKLLVAVGLIATVCLRSYVGGITAFAWKAHYALAFVAVCSIVVGKMLGGIIADKAGFVRTAAISLGVSAVLFVFAFKSPLAGFIALVCFNMTMPLTLTALANLMPHNKGFSFGILTAALFVGFVPCFGGVGVLASPVGLCMLSVLSAVLLIPALYWGGKYAR